VPARGRRRLAALHHLDTPWRPHDVAARGTHPATEALDLTTAAGRAMAAMPAVFAGFERDFFQERTRAGLAHARMNGKKLRQPMTTGIQVVEIRKLHRKLALRRHQQIGNRAPTSDRAYVSAPHAGVFLPDSHADSCPW
jgi:DNA invertase Pin-like site-specific DNA recombinase